MNGGTVGEREPVPRQVEVHAAFVRFRDRHDHEALALVFDRTAQGLLLVAHHLAGPGVDAEDLVQATFVHAIRNAHAFDADRPLKPWLLAILTNEAHNARRKAARRPDAARLRGEPSDDPGVRAEQREQVELLRAAIETMPEPMRSALVLYLVHGMTPTAIAHALGQPVGSVKSQVHRGIARLRGRLPVGLAAVPLWPAAPPRWFAVREVVLRCAREVRLPAPVGTAVADAVRPNALRPLPAAWRWAAAVVVVAAVPVVGWAVAATPAPVPNAARMAAAAAAADRAHDADGAPRGDPRAADAVVAPAAELHIMVRWADGTPAPEVYGGVEPRFAADARLRRVDVVTGGAGDAWVRGLAPGPWVVVLGRGVARDVVLRPGRNELACELPDGAAVRGRVLGVDGQPVAAASVWLAANARRDDGFAVARSDASGAFAVRDVPPGMALAAFADGFAPTRCCTVGSPPVDGAGVVVDLQFERRAGSARVVVLAADGSPCGGALVQIGASEDVAAVPGADDDCRPGPPWVGRCGDDGGVECHQTPADARVAVFARAAGAAGACRWSRASEHGAGIELRLPAARAVEGVVVGADQDTWVRVPAGSVAPLFAAVCPAWFLPQVRVAPDGRWALAGAPCHAFVVEARGGAGFALADRPGGIDDTTPCVLRLSHGSTLTGDARGSDGTSLAGCRVELHAPGFVHRGEVDATGSFRCAGLGELAWELVVREPDGVGDGYLLRTGGVRAGGSVALDVPLAAVPSATVRGRMIDAGGTAIVVAEIASAVRAHTNRVLACSEDGSFVAGALPAGEFVLLGGGYPYRVQRAFTLRRDEILDLGTIVAEAPARCVVTAATRPGSGCEVHLTLAGGVGGMVAVARWLGSDPSVVMPAPPGDYLLSLTDHGALVHQQRVVLAPGSEVAVTVPAAAAVRCTFAAEPSDPMAWTWVHWRIAGEGRDWRLALGPRLPGQARAARFVTLLPPGRYRVEAGSDLGEVGATAVRVEGGSDAGPFSVRLRAPR